MHDARILAILYDMALVIGSTDRLQDLLSKTLQRLLYHTGFPAGLALLRDPGQAVDAAPRLMFALGDHSAVSHLGEIIEISAVVSTGEPALVEDAAAFATLPVSVGKYRAGLYLPIPRGHGCLILLSGDVQADPPPWGRILTPVLGNFAHAIDFCRLNEEHTRALVSERDEARLRLERFSAALDESPDYILLLDPQNLRVLDSNVSAQAALGCQVALGCVLTDVLGGDGDDVPEWRERFERLLNGDQTASRLELGVELNDGSRLPLDIRLSVLERDDAPAVGIVIARDIAERKRAKEQLFAEKERALVTLQSIGDAVITTDLAGNIEYLNPRAEALTAWPLSEARGLPLAAVFQVVNEYTREPIASPVQQVLEKGDVVGLAIHTVLIARDGKEVAVEDSAAPIRDRDGALIGTVMVFHDVSDARELTRQLSWQATHDVLTGLHNRREFERRLQEALQSARHEGRQHMLLYLDLDQFKLVNDTSGHMAGDHLLKRLAERFIPSVRKSDLLARLGGDEFGLLLEDCPLAQAQQIAEEMLRNIGTFRFVWEARVFEVSASIGIAPIDAETEDAGSVMSAADLACYAAKDRGRNRVQVYEPTDADLIRRRGEMHAVADLRRALEHDGLVLYAQRIQALCCETPPYYEVLVRMLGQDGELVSPGLFIPAAERFGLMPDIDRWVIRHAFAALRTLPPGVMFSINLSGASLSQDGLLEFVRHEMRENGIVPEHVCFEITETAAIAGFDEALGLIEALRTDGCRFSLDDFGTGLSSFGYLKTLPVDFLKIDGSFVRGMRRDSLDHAVVEAVNNIAHVLGKRTVAEFVESPEILQRLHELGVDYAQGYAVERPQPIESLCSGSAVEA